MAMNSMLKLIVISSLCSSISALVKNSNLPSLWSTTWPDKSYHVIYQFEASNLDELLTIEEWASFDKQMIRLDMILGNNRLTYLTYGETGEHFHYKPFTCQQVKENEDGFEMLSRLFLGYPLGKSQQKEDKKTPPVQGYGIGPLWLRANERAASVVHKNGQQEDSQEFPQEFDEYEIELSPEDNTQTHQAPFKLRFYFQKAGYMFVDSIDWIVVKESESGSKKLVEELEARAKILYVDTQPMVDESVFRLPIGYGCKRNQANDESLQIDFGLLLLHEGLANQVNFDFVTSRPTDTLLTSWLSKHYSLQLMRMSQVRGKSLNELENYFASELQERNDETGRLHKIRQIWWQPRDDKSIQALVYTIDQYSGQCKIEHRHPAGLIELKFPFNVDSVLDEFESATVNFPLSLEQITILFGNNDDYHLIDPGETVAEGRFRNRLYERRFDEFTLNGSGGSPDWTGPVSVVKQISSHNGDLDQLNKSNPRQLFKKLNLARDYKTKLIMYFYSKDYRKLIYKAIINVVGNHRVDLNYAHEQLDVSMCYPSEKKKDIVIKYPIESQELNRRLRERRKQLRVQSFVNLFEQSTSFLSPLQITNIRPTFDAFYMHLRMTLLDIPLSHAFKLKKGYTLLVDKSSRMSILELTASSALKCSEHCELRNCFRFAYEQTTRSCKIELIRDVAKVDLKLGGELYTYNELNRSRTALLDSAFRSHFSPEVIREIFEEQTMEKSSQLDQVEADVVNFLEIGLTLKKDDDSDIYYVKLRPSSIEYNLETMNEYSRDLKLLEDSSESEKSVINIESGSLKVDYQLFAHDKRYPEEVGNDDSVYQMGTYEECAQICSTNDCRSFSYCQQTEKCIINQAHHEKDILERAVASDSVQACAIYLLDYLSKFESYDEVKFPKLTRLSTLSRTVGSPRDCASNCMAAYTYSCQGFYHCDPDDVGDANKLQNNKGLCYLTDEHINYYSSEQVNGRLLGPNINYLKSKASNDGDTGALKSGRSCRYYSRSYLAQFDKYRGKKIEPSPEANTRIGSKLYVQNFSSEICAKRCIEMDCLAFSVCPSKSGKFFQQSCLLVNDQIRRDQIKAQHDCTSFVLSDRSHFNRKGLKLVEGNNNNNNNNNKADLPKADSEASPGGGMDAEQERKLKELGESLNDGAAVDVNAPVIELISGPDNKDSRKQLIASNRHWFAKIISFMSGLLIGSCFIVIYNEAYARDWLNRAHWRLFIPS